MSEKVKTEKIATTNENKKLNEEKKYAQLTIDSVKLIADAASHANLPNVVAALIAEDVNYRLREVLQSAVQFMRHSNRKKLSVRDLNKALHWSNVEPIFGHNDSDSVTYCFVKEAELFCIDERECDLFNKSSDNEQQNINPDPALHGQWVAVEGVPKPMTAIPGSESSPTKKVNPPMDKVPDAHMTYYEMITKSILGNDEKVLEVAIEDLSRNTKITPLLSYLCNFVAVGVKKMSHDLAQLTKLLQTIQALLNNPFLYIGHSPYLHLLVKSVLYCIVEPLSAVINPINDHWVLRDLAAQLLARILNDWNNSVIDLYESTLSTLEDIFKDLTKPFCSHYGAVIAILTLGIDAVENVLLKHLKSYWDHLNLALSDCSYTNAQIKADAQKVHGLLLVVCELVMRSRIQREFSTQDTDEDLQKMDEDSKNNPFQVCDNNSVSNDIDSKDFKLKNHMKSPPPELSASSSSFELYNSFNFYYGDAFCARLPIPNVKNIPTPKKTEEVQIFSCPELLQSGEELLEKFYENDNIKNSFDDGNSYDERDDISVLSDDHETDPVDLQVKSTVSDPKLGIKLTITKRRRVKPVEETRPAKKRKLMIKKPVESVPVFEQVPLISKSKLIDFNFSGSAPIPRYKLKQKVLQNSCQILCSKYMELHKKMKKTGKKRPVDKSKQFQSKLQTGSLMNIL